nr:ABC transporter permease [Pseudooceanicola algae]
MLAADGRPLKSSLNRALRRQKLRALGLIAPLLIFVLVTFIAPIADMLFRSVENDIVSNTLPGTVEELNDWDVATSETPDEAVYRALYYDLFLAAEAKEHTKLGSRLNYEKTGLSSLFRSSGRGLDDFGDDYLDQLEEIDERWAEGAFWYSLMTGSGEADESYLNGRVRTLERMTTENLPGDVGFAPSAEIAALLPETTHAYSDFASYTALVDGDVVAEEDPWESVYVGLMNDLQTADLAAYSGPEVDALRAAQAADIPLVSAKDFFAEEDEDWVDPSVWSTIQTYSPRYTPGYFLNSVDMQLTPEGMEMRPDNEQVYIKLFKRTMFMSLMITGSCILLGYPVAWLLANLPMRKANLLMILVLLPFWTSLLVRTSAWKVMLQQQGVINDVLVWLGMVDDMNRLVMINNQFGTIVAMTHILLPFMILPLYSVMQGIPPTYLRAAKSLGATNWTAFWRVYFPQSVPGIGAGSILVFILSIGYYITPEIVGGTTGTFISNRIAYHISSSLNWGLAAALGTILLGVVLLLYWAYDRIVGIDNVKLG